MTNATNIMNMALASRGMVPLNPACPCCGNEDRYDFSPASDWKHGDALVAKYGSMPCTECADRHAACDCCGTAFDAESADATSNYYGSYCSPDCEAEDASDRSEDDDHIRLASTH